MKLEVSNESYKPKDVALSQLKPTDIFYFSYYGMQNAFKEDAIFMVMAEKKDDRIAIINIKDAQKLLRDGNHRVVKLNAKIVYEVA